jgi:hypothetical protein
MLEGLCPPPACRSSRMCMNRQVAPDASQFDMKGHLTIMCAVKSTKAAKVRIEKTGSGCAGAR